MKRSAGAGFAAGFALTAAGFIAVAQPKDVDDVRGSIEDTVKDSWNTVRGGVRKVHHELDHVFDSI